MIGGAVAPPRANFKACDGLDARLAQQFAITKSLNGRATLLMPQPNPNTSPRANLRAGRRSSGWRWSRAIAALLFCSARWLRGSGCGTGSRPAGCLRKQAAPGVDPTDQKLARPTGCAAQATEFALRKLVGAMAIRFTAPNYSRCVNPDRG